jgi:DNA-binding transcriptional ArsR family regulator
MSQASVKFSDGKLPAELAAMLDPGLVQALENPTRREILRTLSSSERGLGLGEVASRFTGFTLSEVGYHVRVLERSGAAIVDDERSASSGAPSRYASGVLDNVQALSALRATQQWDRERRQARARFSSNRLTMFRVPRPVQSIRLGHRGGKGR